MGQQKLTHVQLCICLGNHALDLECQVLGLGLEGQVLGLGLGLGCQVLGLGLEGQVLGLGLGLACYGLDSQVCKNFLVGGAIDTSRL